MRYIDTGSRDSDHALGTWLDARVLQDPSIAELRWQTGFFGADSLGYFAPPMSRLRAGDGVLRLIVGSNEGTTTRADIEALLTVVGPPRSNLRIGIVNFVNAYFHPKTIHLNREDGSAAAYVGSANLTGSGVTALHIESGVLFDTRDGDDPGLLADIAAAVDWWFEGPREGLTLVGAVNDLDGLVRAGIINVPRAVPVPQSGIRTRVAEGISNVRLRSLLKPPPLPAGVTALSRPTIVAAPPSPQPVVPSVPSGSPKSGTAAQWGKTLTRSDAQRKSRGNQRGSITLVQAGHPIDAQRYFRYALFATAHWNAGVTQTGEPLEIARIPFEVEFLGNALGVLDIDLTYARNREAAQANYTSLLHLGALGSYFLRHDVTGRWFELNRRADGTYSMSIS